jgi:hypothetical protein
MKDATAMSLIVETNGNVRCVYGESVDLRSLGRPEVVRASHVESNASGQWWADLAPVHGPKLGPFDHRSEALAAEHQWLEDHWLESST